MCASIPPMSTLIVQIVPPMPVDQAEWAFATWRNEHPQLMAIAKDEWFVLTDIRGAGSTGAPLAKRAYTLAIDDTLAALLVAQRELMLDVVVVEQSDFDSADEQFQQWWRDRTGLQALVGQHGFLIDATEKGSSSNRLRRYRVLLPQREAALLGPATSPGAGRHLPA